MPDSTIKVLTSMRERYADKIEHIVRLEKGEELEELYVVLYELVTTVLSAKEKADRKQQLTRSELIALKAIQRQMKRIVKKTSQTLYSPENQTRLDLEIIDASDILHELYIVNEEVKTLIS